MGNSLNMLLTLLLLPLFTFYLSPKDYGIIANLNLFSLFISAIFTIGFGTSFGIEYTSPENRLKKHSVVYTSLSTLFISSILMVLLGTVFCKQIATLLFSGSTIRGSVFPIFQYGHIVIIESYKLLILLILFQTFFQNLTTLLMLTLQFEEQQIRYITSSLLSVILTISFNVVFVIIIKDGITGYVFGSLLGRLFSFIITYTLSNKYLSFSFNYKILKNLLRLGLPVIPGFFVSYILQQGNVFFISKYRSISDAGLYSIGFNFASAILIVVSAFVTAWTPFFLSYKDKKDEVKSIVWQDTYILYL